MTDKRTKDETALLAKIAGWDEPYRAMGERLHELVTGAAPELRPKLWYGMPGYNAGGPNLVFFRVDGDLVTFGLSEHAHHEVEQGAGDRLMPSAWFLRELDAPTEKRLAAIVRRAVPAGE